MKRTAVGEFTDLRSDARARSQKQALQIVAAPGVPESPGSVESPTGLKHIPSGTILIYQGRRVSKVHMIHSGLVMLLRRSANGSEVMIGLRSDGWYAGAISAILDKPSDYSVKTVTGCRTAQIIARQFAHQEHHNPDMMRHFTLALCQEITARARKQRRRSRRAEDGLTRHVHDDRFRRGIDAAPSPEEQELAQLLSLSQKHLGKLMYEIQGSQPAEGLSANYEDLVMDAAPCETRISLTPMDVLHLASEKNNREHPPSLSPTEVD